MRLRGRSSRSSSHRRPGALAIRRRRLAGGRETPRGRWRAGRSAEDSPGAACSGGGRASEKRRQRPTAATVVARSGPGRSHRERTAASSASASPPPGRFARPPAFRPDAPVADSPARRPAETRRPVWSAARRREVPVHSRPNRRRRQSRVFPPRRNGRSRPRPPERVVRTVRSVAADRPPTARGKPNRANRPASRRRPDHIRRSTAETIGREPPPPCGAWSWPILGRDATARSPATRRVCS